MANPQLEEGHTRVANEILVNIVKYPFNGSQYSILLTVWRYTYGFGRKKHRFSISFLEESTKLTGRTITKEISSLVENNVLLVAKEATNKAARELTFNKDYESWKVERRGEKMGQIDIFEVNDPSPLEVNNTSPQSNDFSYFEVNDPSPKKESKSLKKDFKENVDVLFNDFYQAYPRKISKAAAQKAWAKLAKEVEFDPTRIIANTLNYAETCKLLQTETKFIPHPSTYLNQERYADYPFIDPEGLSTSLPGKSKKYTNNQEAIKTFLERGQQNDRAGNSEISRPSMFSISDGGDDT